MRNYIFSLLLAVLYCTCAPAQMVPMRADAWQFPDSSVTFIEHLGVPALKIGGPGEAIARNANFTVGTIEFDFYVTGPGFCGITFRRPEGADLARPDFYAEYFYVRTFFVEDPLAPGAIQYAPFLRGVNLWDLLYDYQAGANIRGEAWNRVKMVVSERQMKVYLNNTEVLWIPELLGEPSTGSGISFSGGGIYANLKLTPGAPENLPATAGADLSKHDVRYLRNWEYGPEFDFPADKFLTDAAFPDSTANWTPITAERGGLINLTRSVSAPFSEQKRRLVWLRTTVNSETDQTRRLRLGYSDDAYVFVDQNFTYMGTNYYGRNIQKQPDGRLSLDNATIDIPLKKGENEIMIAVVNGFYGWGMVARWE